MERGNGLGVASGLSFHSPLDDDLDLALHCMENKENK